MSCGSLIEKGIAYDSLKEKLTELERENQALMAQSSARMNTVLELEQQLKKAEEVIEFYGNEMNYYQAWGQDSKNSLVKTDVDSDKFGGKLARQYLKSRGE